jgi:hypothetical protein
MQSNEPGEIAALADLSGWSPAQTEIVEIPRGLLDCLTDMLAYAT